MENSESNLLIDIDKSVEYHKFWREVSMWLYVITTVFSLLNTAVGSILAALEYSIPAAIVGASAGVFIGLEKSLKFKEKWKLHLGVLTELENLKLKFKMRLVETKDAVNELCHILENYSQELPFEEKKNPGSQ